MLNKRLYFFCCLMLCAAHASNTIDDHNWQQKPQVKAFIKKQIQLGFLTQKDLLQGLSRGHIQKSIIEKITRPYEDKPWPVYQHHFVSKQRIKLGRAYMKQHRRALHRAQKQYAVPASVITAVIGIESNFGKHQSNFKAIDALCTLAFFYPKRAHFFQSELAELLRLAKQHHWPIQSIGASYAGAMGIPQFMPSSYRRFAVSARSNQAPDLFKHSDDAILSIAHYLHAYGWQPGQAMMQFAKLSHRSQLNHQHHWPITVPVQHLKKLGVISKHALPKTIKHVKLWRIKGFKSRNIIIGLPNFDVMLHYNRSPAYALSAALLAQKYSG